MSDRYWFAHEIPGACYLPARVWYNLNMENTNIGQRFGRLLVTRHATERGSRYYECACDCGGAKTASIYDLRRGFTRSCGCLKREASAAAGRLPKTHLVNDLTGRRFGMLTVVERSINTKHGCAQWSCLCDCGESKVISGNRLVTGTTASCGCAYRNRLVVRPEHRRKWSNEYVKNRYRTDVRYSVNRRALHLIHATLKARGSRKSQRWEEMVGYSIEDLVKRLKRTMPKGCTWDDFLAGLLHIEHIVPLSAFNFREASDLDFRRAWALTNLRLLPGPDNLSKADSLDGQFQPSLSF